MWSTYSTNDGIQNRVTIDACLLATSLFWRHFESVSTLFGFDRAIRFDVRVLAITNKKRIWAQEILHRLGNRKRRNLSFGWDGII